MSDEVFKPLEELRGKGQPDVFEDPCILAPMSRDGRLQRDVFERYITSFRSLDSVAEECGVPIQIVLRWAKMGEWVKRRSDIEKIHVKDLNNVTRIYAAEQRKQESEDMLRSGQKIRKLLERELDRFESGDAVTASQLKMLAESLIAASTVTSRAVGLSDGGKVPDDEVAMDDKKGKVPLVMVNVAASVRKSGEPTVTINGEEVT